MSGLIVVGIDSSEGSLRALKWAIEEARFRGATVRALLAWSYLDQPRQTFDPQYSGDDARRQLDDLIATVDHAGVTMEPVTVNELPSRALLEAAKTADLVVVGSRGVGGFQGLLLGSISQQVAQHSPCPVVIVPGEERIQRFESHSG